MFNLSFKIITYLKILVSNVHTKMVKTVMFAYMLDQSCVFVHVG